MNFMLEEYPYHADILSREPHRVVARVYISHSRGPFPVCDDQGCFLFSVWRVEDAISEFEKHHIHYDPPWQPIYSNRAQQGLPNLFLKRTIYGELRVEQINEGSWIALRDGLPLRQGGRDATFGSCGYAQRIAELHVKDYCGCEPIPSDGFRPL
jgi:hypothetical protein